MSRFTSGSTPSPPPRPEATAQGSSTVRNPALALVWLVPAAVLVSYAFLFWRTGMGVQTPPPWPRWSMVDFRDTVWVPVRDMFAGHDPYDLTNYLLRHPASQEFPPYAPGWLLVSAPFAALPWPAAMLAWGVVTAAALAVLARSSADVADRAGPAWVALPLAFVLLSPVGNQPFSAGQFAPVAAASCLIALITPRASLAAAATAVALVKPQVGLPLLLLLTVQGRWRTALAGAAVAAAVSAPVAAVLAVRSGGVGAWLSVLRRNAELTAVSPATAADRAGSTRVDVVGTLQRIGVEPSTTSTAALTLAALLLSLGCAVASWRLLRRAPDDPRALAVWWASAAGALLLWTPNELYSALVMLPAVLVVAARLISRTGPATGWWMLPGLLLAVPFLHVHRIDAALGLSAVGEVINGSAVLAGTAVAGLVALRLRPRRERGNGGARP